MALGFTLAGCVSTYDTYDGYGYNDYAYGYGQEYIIYNNGYSYGYNAGVIDAITNRMVLEMALDRARAARLLELNRRYFYIFHSMPNYSFGYYTFTPGPPPRGPYGPGYYGGANRPPYGGGYGDRGGYYGRGQGGYRSDYSVNMTDRELEAAAKEYTRSVKSIVGSQNYSKFETRVRSDAKTANRKVNAVRVNPDLNAVRSNASNGTATNTGTATRTRTGTSTNVRTDNSGTAVRSNSNASGTGSGSGTQTNRTRVRSNSNSTGTTPTTTNTNATRSRVRSSSSSSGSATTPTQTNTTRSRVRSSSSSSGSATTPTQTNTTRSRVRSSSSSSGSTTTPTTTNTNTTRSRTRTR